MKEEEDKVECERTDHQSTRGTQWSSVDAASFRIHYLELLKKEDDKGLEERAFEIPRKNPKNH